MHYLERQGVPQVYPNSAATIVSLDPTEGFCQTVNARLAENTQTAPPGPERRCRLVPL